MVTFLPGVTSVHYYLLKGVEWVELPWNAHITPSQLYVPEHPHEIPCSTLCVLFVPWLNFTKFTTKEIRSVIRILST